LRAIPDGHGFLCGYPETQGQPPLRSHTATNDCASLASTS
jgi:hypothetical protein